MKLDTILFEVAWEICNQIGGIYTFIKSKIPAVMDVREDNYYLLGPYFPETAKLDFKPVAVMGECPVGKTILRMRDMGYEIHLGYWLLPSSRPLVILFNPDNSLIDVNQVKATLWNDHQISSIRSDALTDKVLAFGEILRIFFTTVRNFSNDEQDLIAHFHEWMSASCLPQLHKDKIKIATVFTTHATVAGRYLAPNEYDFYNRLHTFDIQEKAAHYNIEAQTGIEKAAAQNANVFTTVSKQCASECEIFLGRSPDSIIPNGLNFQQKFPHESFSQHQKYRGMIDEFVKGLFFPSYHFNMEKTLYFFTSGRYEYRNKGFDITLKALEQLNEKLQENDFGITIILFIISPRPHYSVKADALEARSRYQHMQKLCRKISSELGPRIYASVTHDKSSGLPDINKLLDDELIQDWKKTVAGFKQKQLPAVATHHLVNEDAITDFCRSTGFDNSKNSAVKVVYHNEFMERATSLLGMDYAEFVSGCHLGIFPDLYQPWGYAPMESIVLGTPAIASNLSGFGQFVQANVTDHDAQEMYILDRKSQSDEGAAYQLSEMLYNFTRSFISNQFIPRSSIKNTAIAKLCWSEIQPRYEEIYKLAMMRSQPASNLY
ncbi:glycogen/starch synthase [Dyadobacter subterraneus]|uniref:Glycogen/starch synthase n=1 Tax=Dyadobacter subterraneus TaxID=2773304 RepID=A0ABR9W8J2_9BACT|nr:glycogen/starch synthase [Dyadobacter subterraneus]MBE9461789.1 glycogen/starch synthase [Dyadobacter subterraneus]